MISDVYTDGDYETSSEGVFLGAKRNPVADTFSRSSIKLGSEQDYRVENEESSDDKSLGRLSYAGESVLVGSVLAKSESMPMLKSSRSSKDENEEGNVALTSESSLARNKKMKMIVDRVGPLLSSESNVTLSDVSRPEIVVEVLRSEKPPSKSELPVLEVRIVAVAFKNPARH